MTRVIGINSEFNASMDHIYSGSSALIENNKIIYAIAEERISKIKHAGGFLESLQEIYQKTGLSKDDIDYFSISFYANALIPEEDMIKKHLELLDITDTPKKLIVVPSHHLSHAYLAYFLSPLTSAVIMVADNEGSLLYPREAVER
ncbi:hypothetical protein KA005_19325, partial [bacterium]|nr:hypothetical protein [bacterium]